MDREITWGGAALSLCSFGEAICFLLFQNVEKPIYFFFPSST